jgi:ribulose-phosphate 3-epimerase
LIVVHYEADLDHKKIAEMLREHDIKAGLAILQDTNIEEALPIIESFDHVLVFSGKLGFHGGKFDDAQLEKVKVIKQTYPKIEISWDGGINAENAPKLIEAGVEVLNVGGYIQKSDDPAAAYAKMTKAVTA